MLSRLVGRSLARVHLILFIYTAAEGSGSLSLPLGNNFPISLPLSFPVLSLSLLSQWTCNPVSAGPVGGRGGGSHAAVVVSLSLFHSKSALFPSWDDCARWTTDTGTEGECEGRATWEWGTGWRHRDGGDILCLVKWASPRTKTNPALPSSRPGIDSGCEATRAHKHAGTTHGWMSICDSLSQTTNALFSHAEEVAAAAAFLFLPPAPDNRRSRAFPPLGRLCSLCGLSRRGSS